MNIDHETAAEAWSKVPIVTVFRPVCPYCQHEKYVPIRSFQNGDNTTTKRAVCKSCARRYIVVREPLPKIGNHITWPDKIQE